VPAADACAAFRPSVEMRIGPFQPFAPLPLQRVPRAPRMRRRFAYTAARASVFFFHRRRPR